MVIVVMGVAGAGKTTVGRRLAEALGWPFHDGDDHHSDAAVARMRAGEPLDDALRAPWLAALAALVAGHVAAGTSAVLACSALRRAYRGVLRPADAPAGAVRFVFLRAEPALLAQRLDERQGHFFAAPLLESQLATLEAPDAGEPSPTLTLDAGAPVEALVAEVRAAFGV